MPISSTGQARPPDPNPFRTAPSSPLLAPSPSLFSRNPIKRLWASAKGLSSRKVIAAPAQPARRSANAGQQVDEPANPEDTQAPLKNAALLDLDDAVVPMYNLAKSGIALATTGGGSLPAQADSIQLSGAPQTWVQAQSGAFGGQADMALGIGAGAAVLPFAAMSVKVGVQAAREAWNRHQILTARRSLAGQNVASASAVLRDEPGSSQQPDRLAAHTEAESLQDVERALRHASYDGAIGIGFVASGVVVTVKAAEDVAIQSVAMAASHNSVFAAVTATALPTVATAAGIAGTIVLGPLIAGVGVALGGVVLHQARRIHAELRMDRRLMSEADPPATGEVDPVRSTYVEFIDRKLVARERFAARLKRWGAGYLTGTCLAAVSAAAKAALGVAALGGVAAVLANPVGLTVVLGLAIVGGVMMAVGSWQFVSLRGKNLQQQSYRSQESRFLSRKLDSLHTACCARMGGGIPGAEVPGAGVPENPVRAEESALRASLYEFVRTRDSARQTLLHGIALQTGKAWSWRLRSSEKVADRPPPTRARQRLRSVGAALKAAGEWLAKVASGAGREAAGRAALEIHAKESDRLTTTGLALWLDDVDRTQPRRGIDYAEPPGPAEHALRTQLEEMLAAQRGFPHDQTRAQPRDLRSCARADVGTGARGVCTDHPGA